MSSTTPLATFPNPRPERKFEIAISCPGFTPECPNTGLPDFGEIRIIYVPADHCIELKSLNYCRIGLRDRGIFCESAIPTLPGSPWVEIARGPQESEF